MLYGSATPWVLQRKQHGSPGETKTQSAWRYADAEEGAPSFAWQDPHFASPNKKDVKNKQPPSVVLASPRVAQKAFPSLDGFLTWQEIQPWLNLIWNLIKSQMSVAWVWHKSFLMNRKTITKPLTVTTQHEIGCFPRSPRFSLSPRCHNCTTQNRCQCTVQTSVQIYVVLSVKKFC